MTQTVSIVLTVLLWIQLLSSLFFLYCSYMFSHVSYPAIHKPHVSVSVAGITETIAQLASGWVTDRNLFHKYHYHKAYLILCGLVNLLSPLATSYILLMVYAVFFAIFCGGYMALLLPVLVRRLHYLNMASCLYSLKTNEPLLLVEL